MNQPQQGHPESIMLPGQLKVVRKRDGSLQNIVYDKITNRLNRLAKKNPPLTQVSVTSIAQRVINGMADGMETSALDILAAETTAYFGTIHPEYGKMASRIIVSNMHKETDKDWMNVVNRLYSHVDTSTGQLAPMISKECYKIISSNINSLSAAIDYSRDYQYDFFGYKTLERSYLFKIDDRVVERPQQMLMRVSVGIHKHDITAALKTYDLMSRGFYTHASPTLFNSGTPTPQMSSCFLTAIEEDSIEGIYKTLSDCAKISKTAGGLGISVTNIRSSGSYIRGTGGKSNGLVPMLRVYNDTARYVDQGGGKRKGAFAIYLEPWHADIEDFLDLKKNHGKEETRARDLFYGLWIPDLFMKRVEEDKTWSLFCPGECKGLYDSWGQDFESLYENYEQMGKARKTLRARDLWFKIIGSQIETGVPYMLYKDACNSKSNQQHLGTIRSSNLCTEIIQYTSPDEIAVCNLASVALPKFVASTVITGKHGEIETVYHFDHDKLYEVTKHALRSLNRMIDENYYPLKQAEKSNKLHRPVGLGVQGLADVFAMMKLPFCSKEAKALNVEIFETMYFAAAETSCELAKECGYYQTYPGSPASNGILCPDFYKHTPSARWDFQKLRQNVKLHGLRNSLMIAPMPTASTANILGNNECFEPYTSNIYVKRVLSGEFIVVNKHLVRDLMDLDMWSQAVKDRIIEDNGSVQGIDNIPNDIKERYKTVWEMSMKDLCDMSRDRAPFVDQSQSFSAFLAHPTKAQLTSMHFYTWKSGLKTGMYYLRTKPATQAIKFTIDKKRDENEEKMRKEEEEKETQQKIFQNICPLNGSLDGCLSCSG